MREVDMLAVDQARTGARDDRTAVDGDLFPRGAWSILQHVSPCGANQAQRPLAVTVAEPAQRLLRHDVRRDVLGHVRIVGVLAVRRTELRPELLLQVEHS